MKILTATPPAHPRPEDFCEGNEGEVVVPHATLCTHPIKGMHCGCTRSHIGLASGRSTTTVLVTVTDWRLDELTPIALDYLHLLQVGRTVQRRGDAGGGTRPRRAIRRGGRRLPDGHGVAPPLRLRDRTLVLRRGR